MRALALACEGVIDEAEAEIEASESITTHLEARGLRAFAKALTADRRGDDAGCHKQLEHALSDAQTSGNADSFVVAYRLAPKLLNAIAGTKLVLSDFLMSPLVTYDSRLAERAGLGQTGLALRPATLLTDREEEVLKLLRQGMSNREIAQALWIAPSTAKVHVRHIFEKLGVRSRTEAALFRAET